MVTYKEHIVKRKKSGKDILIYIFSPFLCMIAAYIVTFVILNFLPFLSFLTLLVWAFAVYALARIVLDRNIEFEYLLVDSDLDIDKIHNKSRRKRMISLYRKEIIAIAPFGSANLPHGWSNMEKVDASVSPDSDDTYVIVVKQSDKERAVLFCPTEEMLEIMDRRNPGKVFKD